MVESTFIPKIEAACRKKEGLFDTSKGKYAVRSIFAGAFLTFSTGAGAIAADLTNKIVPGHCTPIMGQEKKPLMRPVFCTLQETGHLISVEF